MELISMKGLRATLPYLRKFSRSLFVVKLGGEAIESNQVVDSIIEQLTILHQLGIRFVIVHGGGKQSTELCEKLGISTQFIEGRRVTSSEAIDALVMSLNGSVRTRILCSCRKHQLSAVGISGIDATTITASKRPPVATKSGRKIDFGWVGDIKTVNVEFLQSLIDSGVVPIVSSLASDDSGQVLNINADSIASAIAKGLGASKLILVTQKRGILKDVDDSRSLISELSISELKGLEDSGIVFDGMLPKSKAITDAIQAGVERVHIVSFEYPDCILVEVFTNEGCGTMIRAGDCD